MNFISKLIFIIIRGVSEIYTRMKVDKIGVGCKINRFSIFTCTTTIGNYCHFNGITVIGKGSLVIDDYFHSGGDVLVLTQNHNYYSPSKLPYDSNDTIKDVTIGKGVWIGSNVIILPGCQIGDGVVVQAGSVVHGKINEGEVVGGNPAKLIKTRDMERYFFLKKNNKYSKL
jgi:acetyltransferase-like isoleucine patch superfamily enzyme